MGDYIQGLPVGSKNFINCEETFLRVGEDGSEPIFSLIGTKKFFGEVLSGLWLKHDDGVLVGPWTALLNAGDLELTGAAAVAGNFDDGWIISKNHLYMFPGTFYDVHMKMPAHATATRFFWMGFYFISHHHEASPESSEDHLSIILGTDDTNYLIYIHKHVAGVSSDIYPAAIVVNAEGTFRVKRELDGDYTFYYHVGPGAIDEATDEIVAKSDIGLNFDFGEISYSFNSSDAALRILVSEKLDISYPNFEAKYDLEDADINKGDVQIFDGDPDASGIQVFDEDHNFADECYIQNGLIRLHIDEGVRYGLNLYSYIGGSWVLPFDRIFRPYLLDNTTILEYYFVKRVIYYSVDKIVLQIRVEDSNIQDGDYYVDFNITIERGKYNFSLEFDDVHPTQNIYVYFEKSSPASRFGYVGDAGVFGIGDDDLNLYVTNTTMSDNFLMSFDPDQTAVLGLMATSLKPSTTGRFIHAAESLLSIRTFTPANLKTVKLFFGLIPYVLIADLFKEAEDATTDGDIEADPTASGGFRVKLNAQNEYVQWDRSLGWLDDWFRRVKITIDSGDIDAVLTNWPVLIKLGVSVGINSEDLSFIFDALQSNLNRFKIAVTAADGVTQCYVEIEKFDFVNEEAWLWVRVPTVSNIVDTVIYLYYDRLQPDNSTYVGDPNSVPAETVWDINHVFVSHMRDDPDTSNIRDSSTNDNDGVKLGANQPPLLVAGMIGEDQDFDGIVDHVEIVDSPTIRLIGNNTLEAWVKPKDLAGSTGIILSKRSNSFNKSDYDLRVSSAGVRLFYTSGGASKTVNSAAWVGADGIPYHIVGRYDGTFLDIWINGVRYAHGNVGVMVIDVSGFPLFLGRANINAGDSYGKNELDEVRVIDTDVSDAWIKANYETGRDHILDFGSEEVGGSVLGHHLAIFRIRDLNQIALDVETSVTVLATGALRNQENADVHQVVTAAWLFYQLIFEIRAGDATLRFKVKKDTAAGNDVFVDDFLIIPIGNGRNWPQDLAHSALRSRDQLKRVFER